MAKKWWETLFGEVYLSAFVPFYTEHQTKQEVKFIKDARDNHQGIFENNNSLMLIPFELRFLSRRCEPSRYVLDLSKNDAKLLKPTDYHKIKNPEDRLFIPNQFVPLFEYKNYETVD